MLILRPMTESVYLDYIQASVQNYAAEGRQSEGRNDANALTKAQTQFDGLLPQGLATPDHFFFELLDAAREERVGELWVALRGGPGRRQLFIYDIAVRAEMQGRGYGTQAIEALKTFAREQGARSIGLHVFGHNRGALRLYERLGFEATNIQMRLNLVP